MRSTRVAVFMVLLSLTAAALPDAQPAAPTPADVIGFPACADYQLATYEQIAEYFHQLDAASDRLQLVDIGRTAEGRTQLMAIISSEQNMQRLSRFKAIAKRLALARDLSDADARALAAEGRAVVWIDFGLHSTEVAHGQVAPLMAYRAVTEETDEMKSIRDNVIFILIPNMNPDGTTLVANWYMEHVGTPYEQSRPPELYQKYVGHDNNRDWFMFNQPESQNVARQLYAEWFPQIVYNQHQSAPFPARIFVPPFEPPMNPNIPPLVMRGIHAIGGSIARRLDQEGKSGAISRINYDTWWNGGMRTAPYYHNMIGILTETGHASATPATYDPKDFPKTFANGVPTLEPSTDYPNPYRGGEWHLRDSCDYMLTASMAVLDIGAKRRQEWLHNIYLMGRQAIDAGGDAAYVISADQWDPGTAVKMVNALRWGGIEVARATAPFQADGKTYPAGSFVIHEAQPFRPHLVDLLNPQVYPDLRLYPGGPPDQPYDITGWTLPLQMGVQVDRVRGIHGEFEPIDRATVPVGSVAGRTDAAYAIDPRANDAFTAVNRLLADGETVLRSTSTVDVGDTSWPPGTFLIAPGRDTHTRLEGLARTLGLQIETTTPDGLDGLLRLRRPRVGLYHRYGGDIDEGWTRWVLEQFDFDYSPLYDRDVRAGNLRERYDVVLLPDNGYDTMLKGLLPGTTPPEFAGGMTPTGIMNLYRFTEAGGVLVAMDSAAELPLILFGLPLRDVTTNQPASDFYIPGTLLRLSLDPTHPVAFGMPSTASAFFARSPAFVIDDRPAPPDASRDAWDDPADLEIVGQYGPSDLLMSGWLMGDSTIANAAAVVDATVGDGRVILLGFRTQHRGQAHGTFKLLFNAIYRATLEAAMLSGSASVQDVP